MVDGHNKVVLVFSIRPTRAEIFLTQINGPDCTTTIVNREKVFGLEVVGSLKGQMYQKLTKSSLLSILCRVHNSKSLSFNNYEDVR